MAIDIAGFITNLKDHAVEHGFHVHDERHFIETYSLRQSFEVDMHPEEACAGPLDLHLAFDVDPRVVLDLDEKMAEIDDDTEPEGEFKIPLYFNWSLPPLASSPDLIVLATEVAAIGGPGLPIEVSAVESTGAVFEASEQRLSIVGRVDVSLVDALLGRENLCEMLDRGHDVSMFLVKSTDEWGVVEPHQH
jgi:hypothetical protein